MTALFAVNSVRQEIEEHQRWLLQLMKRCPEKDDQTEALLCTVLGRWELEEITQFADVYRRQKERLTVPLSLFWSFVLTQEPL